MTGSPSSIERCTTVVPLLLTVLPVSKPPPYIHCLTSKLAKGSLRTLTKSTGSFENGVAVAGTKTSRFKPLCYHEHPSRRLLSAHPEMAIGRGHEEIVNFSVRSRPAISALPNAHWDGEHLFPDLEQGCQRALLFCRHTYLAHHPRLPCPRTLDDRHRLSVKFYWLILIFPRVQLIQSL